MDAGSSRAAPLVGPRAPQRPLLALALALATGAALSRAASAGPVAEQARLLLVLACLAAWLGLGRALGGTARAALVVGVLAALRTPPLAPEAAPGPVAGPWNPQSPSTAEDDEQRGSVGGLALAVPGGLLAAGEHVRIDPGAPATLAARGPFLPARGAARSETPVHPDEVMRRAPANGGLWPYWPTTQAVRARLLEPLDRMSDPRAAAFLAAFVLGEEARLSHAERDLFTRTGVRHVLAVSGWHVGLLYLLALGPLARGLGALAARLVGPRRAAWVETVTGASLALAYAILAGGAAPVRRAAVAVALARAAELGPRESGLPRRVDGLSLLALAWILECALDPAAPFGRAVQLSYLATLGILVAARPAAGLVARCSAPPSPVFGRAAWCAALGAVARRSARAFVLALATSCVAVAATLPVCWQAFAEWSPIGIVATVLLAPCFAWLLACGALMLCVPGWLPEGLVALPTSWLFAALDFCDRLPGTPWPLPPRPMLLVAAAALLALAWARNAMPLCGRAAALVAGLLLLPWSAAPRRLEVVACDVGHGTAVLARAPGSPVWVFDAGSRDRTGVGREALAPVLAAWEAIGVNVVASHADRDHTGGLGWLVERYPPAVWLGALPAPPALVGERLPHTTLVMDLQEGALELPEFGPLRATLLRGGPLSGNEGSRSLLLEVLAERGERVLLCGDAEGPGLVQLVRLLPLLPAGSPACGLLLLPHHGSDSPWLVPLVERFAPAEAWISSAGPEPPAMAVELARRGLPWRWTGRDGPLSWHGTRCDAAHGTSGLAGRGQQHPGSSLPMDRRTGR